MCSRCGVPACPAPDRGYKEDWIGYSGWLLPCWRQSSVSPSILVRVQPSAIAKGQKENGFCGHKTFSHLSYFEFSAAYENCQKLSLMVGSRFSSLCNQRLIAVRTAISEKLPEIANFGDHI